MRRYFHTRLTMRSKHGTPQCTHPISQLWHTMSKRCRSESKQESIKLPQNRSLAYESSINLDWPRSQSPLIIFLVQELSRYIHEQLSRSAAESAQVGLRCGVDEHFPRLHLQAMPPLIEKPIAFCEKRYKSGIFGKASQ